MTGAYDPEQNLVFYGIGNPGPDYHSESRKGDNLYSNSLVALDADTGKLRWHYQFTPHDVHDWDATEVPILADLPIGGQPRKVVMFANRNGFYYTLDRTNGKVIVAQAVRDDDVGQGDRRATAGPCCCRATCPTRRARSRVPIITGGTNFWPPSFDPSHADVLRERARSLHDLLRVEAGVQAGRAVHRRRRPARAARRSSPAYGALRAIDPATGERKWEFKYLTPSTCGPPDDGVRPGLQRRRRRQPARARLAQRQAALALSDGRDAARHVAHHLRSTDASICSCPRARR